MLDDIFTKAMSAVSGADFEEIPVKIEEFVTSPDFMGLLPLSPLQYQIVRAASQIYKRETLVALYGEEYGNERFEETYNEVVLMLGKGSGKDHCSVIACCYIVYLLLCLKSPSKYYGWNVNEPIDIINVAINAEQARTVFFNRFRDRLEETPWFLGKFTTGNNVIDFDKNVHAYSGHSQREAFEGKNLIVAILDEISAFALESNTGNEQADTADATYRMYKRSVTSRYSDFGKVILLSFPRFYGDYISQRYGPDFNDIDKGMIGAVAEKEVITRSHTFKLHENLPDGIEGNEFTIEWDEDHITRYSRDKVFAMRRPSWEMNPLKKIEDYKDDFYTNRADSLGAYACMPSDSTDDTFFKNKIAIEESFISQNGVDDAGVFGVNFMPDPTKEYYVHVDLSKVHDRCAVALAHVDKWVTAGSERMKDVYPIVRIDAIRWWKPSKENPMDYREVTNYILKLQQKGFNIKLATFDRWNSHDTMNFLEARGIPTELLSVAMKHYDDFLSVMYDQRLVGPKIDELILELKQLRRIKDKVDHPRSGFKDLSDAVCGAIYNAVALTPKPQSRVVDIVSYKSLMKEERKSQEEVEKNDGVIRPPRKMPQELSENLDGISLSAIRII
jgi:hypothetical protein